MKLLAGHLLGDERRDVWLEAAGSDTHDDDADDESAESAVRMRNHTGSRRRDQDDMTSDGNQDRHPNSVEATEIRVGNVSTEKRDEVDPELIEGSKTRGGLLAETESARLRLWGRRIESFAG